MPTRTLITGGAGFIGSHLADHLLESGRNVRVLDSLVGQVHGDQGGWPAYLNHHVERVRGDLTDPAALASALDGADEVVHLASAVGVGQSMYQIVDYVTANDLGTAHLLQALTERPVAKLVVASSMSVYGEGLYAAADGRIIEQAARDPKAAVRGEWDISDEEGVPLAPLPTPETKQPSLASIYAINKFVQEKMCLTIGGSYGISTVALRLFNVYGSRQALGNPYTGVMAIFASRLLNGARPLVFEDGRQLRDFVHVHDVARAFRMALDTPQAAGHTINVASGEARSIGELGAALAAALGRPDIAPEMTNRGRAGDIRHCIADISLAHKILGYRPEVTLESGLQELVGWLEGRSAVDRVEVATKELLTRGLVA